MRDFRRQVHLQEGQTTFAERTPFVLSDRVRIKIFSVAIGYLASKIMMLMLMVLPGILILIMYHDGITWYPGAASGLTAAPFSPANAELLRPAPWIIIINIVLSISIIIIGSITDNLDDAAPAGAPALPPPAGARCPNRAAGQP